MSSRSEYGTPKKEPCRCFDECIFDISSHSARRLASSAAGSSRKARSSSSCSVCRSSLPTPNRFSYASIGFWSTSSLTLWVLCRTTERPLLPRPISSMSLLARLVFEMPGMSMAVSFIGGIEELPTTRAEVFTA